MSRAAPPTELELHAFLDGELPEPRMAEIAAALERDPALAAHLAGFAADQQSLAAAFGKLETRPLPPAWIGRIESGSQVSPGRTPRRWLAIAASVLLLVAGGLWLRAGSDATPILQMAARARLHEIQATASYEAASLPAPAAQQAMLRAVLGTNVRVPDLGRAGYRLTAMQLYRGVAVGLRYRNGTGRELALFLRRSDGEARFDLLRQGRLRVCLWQDDVIGAVLSGEMSAGEMMRIASLAYSELNI